VGPALGGAPPRPGRLDDQQERTIKVLARSRNFFAKRRVTSEMAATNHLQPSVIHVIQIVINSVPLGAKTVFHTVLLEVRFDSRGGKLGMEGREHEATTSLQNTDRLAEECPQIRKMFGHKRAKHGITVATLHREGTVEIGLCEENVRIPPPRYP
jgi:hypothetical protein